MTALSVVNGILIALSILVLLPIATFCAECLAALVTTLPLRNGHGVSVSRPRTTVLIPAHNEQSVIEQTIKTILPALSAGDRLLVVADNCDDQTADVARHLGADVVERHDPQRRGKGYALEHGFRVLREAPPEVVVVIDADCLVERQTIETLARRAWHTQRPVQARNLTDREPAAGPVQAVSILANRVTNFVRPLGLTRLGAPCRMTGTGMAIPWRLIESVPPPCGCLVEDLQWGIDLSLQGHYPLFCPEAGVTSGLPVADGAFVTQRTRWEQGYLQTALTQIPQLLVAAVGRRSWRLLAAAADLGIPPLTLLVLGWLAVAAIGATAWRLGASGLPPVLMAGGGVALAGSLAAAWAVFCRRQVPLQTLAGVPMYVVRKLHVYARLLLHREHSWVRTERPETAHQTLESQATATPRQEVDRHIDAERPQFHLLGVRIHNVTRRQVIAWIEETIHRHNDRPASVFFVNAHTLNLAAADGSYRASLNAGDLVLADGTGIRWAARLQGVRVQENLVGTDFVPEMFRATAGRNYSYFLLGADATTILAAADYARRTFPGWREAGFHHGYLADETVASAAIEAINRARPDVLLVGMGNPIQEQWIERHLPELRVPACLGIGGLFDYWAGNVSRAPQWLRQLGHEWLWRLFQEPRLKARRYLIGNPLFLSRVLRERWQARGMKNAVEPGPGTSS